MLPTDMSPANRVASSPGGHSRADSTMVGMNSTFWITDTCGRSEHEARACVWAKAQGGQSARQGRVYGQKRKRQVWAQVRDAAPRDAAAPGSPGGLQRAHVEAVARHVRVCMRRATYPANYPLPSPTPTPTPLLQQHAVAPFPPPPFLVRIQVSMLV